ncbi:hypothetical protein L6452_23708 [Arctium lappa]|uniref:Uncharacterized protein n=1 Tax=Arctium lappa TaxID=4217 RepID=A0ACB9B2G5_ARCLA|nr:hypothetical protein L6452_23708 [Arctium lappa]
MIANIGFWVSGEIAGEDEVADQPISFLCFDLTSSTLRLDGGDLGFYLQRRFQSDLGLDLFFVEKMSNSKNKEKYVNFYGPSSSQSLVMVRVKSIHRIGGMNIIYRLRRKLNWCVNLILILILPFGFGYECMLLFTVSMSRMGACLPIFFF